jgi:ribosomal protein S12 methylthiotransferase
MQRQVKRAPTEELLGKLRSAVNGLVIRTTFITGFPGETEEQFEELVDFVREQRFERLGVFTYSLEPDTPAARLPDHLPEEVKQGRRERLMEVQQEIAFQWNAAQTGRTLDVLIDGPVPGETDRQGRPRAWIGRSYADAPDVDGVIYVTGAGLSTGALVRCEVVGSQGYDLIAARAD